MMHKTTLSQKMTVFTFFSEKFVIHSIVYSSLSNQYQANLIFVHQFLFCLTQRNRNYIICLAGSCDVAEKKECFLRRLTLTIIL